MKKKKKKVDVDWLPISNTFDIDCQGQKRPNLFPSLTGRALQEGRHEVKRVVVDGRMVELCRIHSPTHGEIYDPIYINVPVYI